MMTADRPAAKKINTDESYEALFQFIARNTNLASMVGQADQVLTQVLLDAINASNFASPIFDDKDCDIFLLRLYKDQKIPRTTFLTLYTLLMGKWEAKTYEGGARQCQLVPMFDAAGNFSPAAKSYFQTLAAALKEKWHLDINLDALIAFVKSQPASESTLIIVRGKKFGSGDDLPLFTHSGSFPCFQQTESQDAVQFCLPSIAIMGYLNTLFTGEPMRLLPGFGRVGNATLWQMHQLNYHFYPLYNRFVQLNLTKVHIQEHGPFWVAVHDLYHTFVASFVTSAIRKEILDLIPLLRQGYEQFYPHQPHKKEMDELLLGDTSLNDLNFKSEHYTNKNNLIERYWLECFSDPRLEYRECFFELIVKMRYAKAYASMAETLERCIRWTLMKENKYFDTFPATEKDVEDSYAKIQAIVKEHEPSVAKQGAFKPATPPEKTGPTPGFMGWMTRWWR
jgi:hypothetical protein